MRRFREWLIPELLRVPDEERRRIMFRQTMLVGMGDWAMIAWLPAAILSPAINSIEPYGKRLGTVGNVLAGLTIAVGLLAAWIALGIMVHRNIARRNMRKLLGSDGIAICVPCGYDLTGNTSGRCPECGATTATETHVKT